jgi:hypothetical protein
LTIPFHKATGSNQVLNSSKPLFGCQRSRASLAPLALQVSP